MIIRRRVLNDSMRLPSQWLLGLLASGEPFAA
jgi:hypothetical protein